MFERVWEHSGTSRNAGKGGEDLLLERNLEIRERDCPSVGWYEDGGRRGTGNSERDRMRELYEMADLGRRGDYG